MVSSPEPGGLTQLGRYTLLHKLATGGTAEVFLARQQGPDGFTKQIVIKKLLPHLAEDRAFVKMFLNEARVAALMSHPNVVSVYDLGQGGDVGDYYIAMEYLSGRNLSELQSAYRERHGSPVPASIAAQIGADACAGLDFAHNLSDPEGKPLHLVHRDISPENIFLTTSGCVKVLDFGIAKARSLESVTQEGQLKGKFGYLSPEQLAGAAVDHRCDVWAMGVTMYGMCAGERPFRGATQTEIFSQILRAEPPPLDPERVPPGLAEIIRMVGDEYLKARPGTSIKSAHVGMAASNTYLLLNEVLPRAIKESGGFTPEALRKAALEVDIPDGGTMLGFGVKFENEKERAPGQNDRSFPVIIQYVDDKPYVVWPKALQVREPVLPLPASSPYAER